jgi:hypothetical protein
MDGLERSSHGITQLFWHFLGLRKSTSNLSKDGKCSGTIQTRHLINKVYSIITTKVLRVFVCESTQAIIPITVHNSLHNIYFSPSVSMDNVSVVTVCVRIMNLV